METSERSRNQFRDPDYVLENGLIELLDGRRVDEFEN